MKFILSLKLVNNFHMHELVIVSKALAPNEVSHLCSGIIENVLHYLLRPSLTTYTQWALCTSGQLQMQELLNHFFLGQEPLD